MSDGVPDDWSEAGGLEGDLLRELLQRHDLGADERRLAEEYVRLLAADPSGSAARQIIARFRAG